MIVGSPSTRATCRIVTNSGGSAGIADKEVVEFSPERALLKPGEPSWCNYVLGVLAQFERVPCFDLAVATDVPIGGGLSSSAALEVSVYTFVEQLLGQSVDNTPAKALACQKAEHDFANMPCGIMDQFICTLGKRGAALLIDCRSLESRLVEIKDPNLVVFIANTNVTHKLSDSEYPRRKADCARAVDVLQAKKGINSLRDATLADLESVQTNMDAVAFRRARHVICETLRCEQAANCFAQGDYARFGKLMVESHESLR